MKLREECGGRVFLEANSYCLRAGEHKPEANHHEISEEHRLWNWQGLCSRTLPFPESQSMRKAGRSSAQDADSESFPGCWPNSVDRPIVSDRGLSSEMEKHLFPDGENLPLHRPSCKSQAGKCRRTRPHTHYSPGCYESLKNLFLCLILQISSPHFVE